MRGTLLGGRYRIQNKIGEGGMAYVYVALDEKLGRKVAIKILHRHMADNPDIRKRFFQEAQAISKLDHPNILKIYDFSGEDSAELWMVTEILQGLNLSELARSFPGRWLHPIIATLVVREISKALEKAHQEGLIHRDIKPENIMVLTNGLVKLMDFGIAKNMRGDSITLTGTFMGSPSYMSPEQIRGKAIDHRSDLYSLSVLFYEIVTGKLPYIGGSTHDVVMKICEGKFKEPKIYMPQLPDDLNKIICKGMDKFPSNRYQEARSFARDLDIFLQNCGFEESHIELERYFTDRDKFEDRLRKLQQAIGPTVVLGADVDPTQVRASQNKTTRTHHTRVLTPAEHAVAQKAAATARDAVRPPTPPPTVMPAAAQTVAAKSNLRYGSSHASQTAMTPSPWDLTQTRPLPSVPAAAARKKRRLPKRHQTQHVVYRVASRSSGRDTTSVFAGIILVSMIIVLTVWGFWGLHKKMQNDQSIKPIPDVPVTEVTQTPRRYPKPINQNEKTSNVVSPRAPERDVRNNPRATAKKNPYTRKSTTTDNQTNTRYEPQARPEMKVVERGNSNNEEATVTRAPAPERANPRPSAIVPGGGKFSYVRISSQPAAEIYIDGRRFGTTVDRTLNSGWLKLPPGAHRLELRRSGYKTYVQNFGLDNQERKDIVNITLGMDNVYTLSLSASKQPSYVMIQGLSDQTQKTLILRGHAQTLTLPSGRYRVRFEYKGQVIERQIALVGNEFIKSLSVNFR